ncbi:helix-turn-helix domain-containing protein [Deferribacter abyssi]|uniref:helix-turn-helix domain-containing protein n=1 Tax=Deferribacter abyssi TaxID=213806 RepID=UPI003C243197
MDLKKKLREANIKQKELASLMGVKESTLSMYLHKERKVPLAVLLKMKMALNELGLKISLEELALFFTDSSELTTVER